MHSAALQMQVEMQMPRGIAGQILLVMVNPSSSGSRGGGGDCLCGGCCIAWWLMNPTGNLSLSACFHCNYALATLFAALALAKTKVRESELDSDSEPACEWSSSSKLDSMLELGFELVMVNLHHRIAPPPRRAIVAAACVVLC